MAKKAFEFSRNSMYVADPLDLCIVGGLSLPAEQRGPVDTAVDKGHALYDPRLELPINAEHLASIDAMGVIVPVVIAKLDELPVVVDGRQRVRMARLANAARAARGEASMKIGCVVQQSKEARLFGVMVGLNEIRVDDSIGAKIEKIKRAKERGISDDDIALMFGQTLAYVRQLLAYDLNATDEVRAAVASGSLAPTAAIHLVRNAKSEGAQRRAIAKLEASSEKPSTRRAIEAAKEESGEVARRPSRKEIAARLEAIGDSADDYSRGAAEALRWVLDGRSDRA